MTLLIYFTYSISYSQSSLDYHEKVIGQYEKPYQKLDLYSDNTFKNYYNYVSFCGVGNLEYTVIGSYTVNEKENRIKLLPKEYTQFKSFYGINKNIPFDSVTTPSSLKLNLNVIVFGDEIFLISGNKYNYDNSNENEFLSFVNIFNERGGDGNLNGNFFKKKRMQTTKDTFNSDESIKKMKEDLGELYGGYIQTNSPLEIRIEAIDESCKEVPFDIETYKQRALILNDTDQSKVKRGMKFYNRKNEEIYIVGTKKFGLVGYDPNSIIKEGDILRSRKY